MYGARVHLAVAAGYLPDHGFGYATVFLAVSTRHVAAFLAVLLSVRDVAPVRPQVLKASL
jgi:hypothetical protein